MQDLLEYFTAKLPGKDINIVVIITLKHKYIYCSSHNKFVVTGYFESEKHCLLKHPVVADY